jgi:glycine reductase
MMEYWKNGFRKEDYCMFKGKKAIILGERDGVPGPAIAACLEAAGAQIIFAVTECFV